MTPVPYPIAYALIGGLSSDSVVKHPEALAIFPEVTLIDFDTAARDALKKTHPSQIERVWEDGRQGHRSIKHEGCFIDHREQLLPVEPEKVLSTVLQHVNHSAAFDEVQQTDEKISVHVKDQTAGEKWIEWRVVRHAASMTYISQTVFFCPRGLPGFLYWYLLYPLHVIKFNRSIRSIVEQSIKI